MCDVGVLDFTLILIKVGREEDEDDARLRYRRKYILLIY